MGVCKQPVQTIPWSPCLGFFCTGKSTQTGKAILKLQLNLPKAKVLYSSATGASEPNNLAYMIRLGCCGFKDMSELVTELNGCAPLLPHILAPGASRFCISLGASSSSQIKSLGNQEIWLAARPSA